MNEIYITSDWHFNHNKEFVYLKRGFSSVEEMNKEIVERYNSVVKSEDIVYCLGDCCLGGASAEMLLTNKELIESLNGRIGIIQGNHCTDSRIVMYKTCKNVFFVKSAEYINYNGYKFLLSHYPTLTSSFEVNKPLKRRVINLCGHSHTTNKWEDWDRYRNPIYHCEVDAHDCYPVNLSQIINEVESTYGYECLETGLD